MVTGDASLLSSTSSVRARKYFVVTSPAALANRFANSTYASGTSVPPISDELVELVARCRVSIRPERPFFVVVIIPWTRGFSGRPIVGFAPTPREWFRAVAVIVAIVAIVAIVDVSRAQREIRPSVCVVSVTIECKTDAFSIESIRTHPVKTTRAHAKSQTTDARTAWQI
jgi:hypothetical protein